jgi:type II secretory pathway component PulF
LDAGTNSAEALALAAACAPNAEVKRRVASIPNLLARGFPLSRAFGLARLDHEGSQAALLPLAEESGDYAGAFRELSLQASTLAQERLDLLTRLAEPMAAVVVAAVAASCLTAMYGPVLGAADLIRGGM